jgi:membrane-bound lytic murein transglycosylase A
VGTAERRSRVLWLLFIANLFAVGAVAWLSWPAEHVISRALRVSPVAFADLPGWMASDPRGALAAFRQSCAVLGRQLPTQPMGGAGYAGSVAQWLPACRAIPTGSVSVFAVRSYFETWFAPLAISAGGVSQGLFTGYYEPELAGSWSRTQRFQIPVYGVPDDLVFADLGRFRSNLAGEHIAGRLDGHRLLPYATRADIDARGLPRARILLYTDDPVRAFFLHIQGSGRVRLADGSVVRVAFAATNGWPYTAIGRVLIASGALDRSKVSLQTIAAWLRANPQAARNVMEDDRSFVFFSLTPLDDPTLGSPGTETVPLTPAASLAVDAHLHPLGAPVYVVATKPDADPARPDQAFAKLLVAQDTGGAIRGPVRGDVFWGFGAQPEAIAGRMKSRGRFYVFVPKPVAATLAPYRDYPGSAQ